MDYILRVALPHQTILLSSQVRHQRQSLPPEDDLRGGRVARPALQRPPGQGLRDSLPVRFRVTLALLVTSDLI